MTILLMFSEYRQSIVAFYQLLRPVASLIYRNKNKNLKKTAFFAVFFVRQFVWGRGRRGTKIVAMQKFCFFLLRMGLFCYYSACYRETIGGKIVSFCFFLFLFVSFCFQMFLALFLYKQL